MSKSTNFQSNLGHAITINEEEFPLNVQTRNATDDHTDNNDNRRLPILQEPKQDSRRVSIDNDFNANLTGQANDVHFDLQALVPLDHMILKQHFESFEMMDMNSPDRSDIFTWKGRRIFYGTKSTSFFCLGRSRPFTIAIFDSYGRRVLILDGPCDCCLCITSCPCLCCCIFGNLGGNMSVSLSDGTQLGSINHVFSCYKPKYKIVDAQKTHLMSISGSCCGDCCFCSCRECGSGDFPIKNAQGEPLGRISKKLSKTFPEFEYLSDADSFGVKFPRNLDVEWKALILASIFLVDMMYFPQSPPHYDPKPRRVSECKQVRS